MSGYQESYDYANSVRDMSEAFQTIVLKVPVLAALVGAPLVGLDGNPLVATNTKHEWLEDSITPKSWVVNAQRVVGGATLVAVSTTGVKVGMILAFESATGETRTVQLVVTAVNVNGTDLSVSVYAGSTDDQLEATDVIKLVSMPRGESSTADADSGQEPTVEYNYTQIFDRTAQVSKTAEAVKKYGIASALNYQVQVQLQHLAYEMGSSIIYGRRSQRTGKTAGTTGTMGGILYYLQAESTNKVDAAGAALSPTILNDAFEEGYGNGADNMKVMICHPVQARKVSAFNTTGNNPTILRDEKTAGSYVMQFVGDLPVGDKGMISSVVVDMNFPKDKIALLDVSQIGIVPLNGRGFTDEDAAAPGSDFYARRVLGEYTCEVRNAGKKHVLIEGLKTT